MKAWISSINTTHYLHKIKFFIKYLATYDTTNISVLTICKQKCIGFSISVLHNNV